MKSITVWTINIIKYVTCIQHLAGPSLRFIHIRCGTCKQSGWARLSCQVCKNLPLHFWTYLLISQMKHQLDATLCRFYFCRLTLHVSGASAHHQEYLKLVRRPLVHVLSLQVSHHISSFLKSHSTCFGHKRPSSGVFKTSTAATGTCVIVAGKSSHLLISEESLYMFRAQAPIIRSI